MSLGVHEDEFRFFGIASSRSIQRRHADRKKTHNPCVLAFQILTRPACDARAMQLLSLGHTEAQCQALGRSSLSVNRHWYVLESQTVRMSRIEAVARRELSGDKASALSSFPWLLRVDMHSAVTVLQILRLPSIEADAMSVPLGDQDSEEILSVWRLGMDITSPVDRTHILIYVSTEADASFPFE